jgi:hypothetical protein
MNLNVAQIGLLGARLASGAVANTPEGNDDTKRRPAILRETRDFTNWLRRVWNDKGRIPDPPAGITRYQLFALAVENTFADVERMTDTVPADPDNTDPAAIGQNNKVWQLFEDNCHWLAGTLGKQEYFDQAPDIDDGTGGGTGGGTTPPAGGALTPEALAPVLMGLMNNAALAQPLIAKITSLVMGGPAAPTLPKPA